MTSQYGAYALQLGWQGYMHSCACTRPRAIVPPHTHVRTDQKVILIAFPRQQLFANAHYMYIACLVFTCYDK